MKTDESVPQLAPDLEDDLEGDSENEIPEAPSGVKHGKSKKEKKIVKEKKVKKTKAKKGKSVALKVVKPRGRVARAELTPENASKDEMKLLKFLFTAKGERKKATIKELQKEVFGGKNTSKTRNTLRPLVKFGWFKQVTGMNPETKRPYRGTYQLTEKGRKRGLRSA